MRRIALAAALAAGIVGPAASPAAAGEMKRDAGAMLAGPTLLSPGRTVVPLRIDRRAQAAAGGRAELVIAGLAYDKPPGVLYEVSLQAADGRRAALGLISFYNRSAPGYGAAPGPDDRRTFDATEALRRLGGEASALVFEPSSGVAGPGPRAAARRGARVRFASVWLK